jgi:hypothetical protein
VADPAARFMSAATAQARTQARLQRASAGTGRTRSLPGLGTALVIALIPLGLGLGVLLGRSSNNQDGKLLAAIAARRQQVVTVNGTAGATNATSTPVSAVKSSFPLSSGYAIELSVLPAGTRQSAAAAAESAARAKGASAVGLVSVSDYSIAPKPPASFVIYSGAFTTRAAAEHGLAKLKRSFPHALVISVKSGASGGTVLARSRFGTATQAAGYKPTQRSLAQGGAAANGLAKKIGKSYVGSQKGLPSVVSVP